MRKSSLTQLILGGVLTVLSMSAVAHHVDVINTSGKEIYVQVVDPMEKATSTTKIGKGKTGTIGLPGATGDLKVYYNNSSDPTGKSFYIWGTEKMFDCKRVSEFVYRAHDNRRVSVNAASGGGCSSKIH